MLTIASVLHTFDIVPAIDEDGKQLDPSPNATTGMFSSVLPFVAVFRTLIGFTLDIPTDCLVCSGQDRLLLQSLSKAPLKWSSKRMTGPADQT